MPYHHMEKAEIQHTVLVVEDEFLIRMCSVATLQDAGYRVIEAGSSVEALAILARPNIVSFLMTDVRMPGQMDGLELVAKVRIDRPDIRPVVVSANVTAEEASDAGAVGMVVKPFAADTLVRAIHNIVTRDLAA